jgi:hypothetical protein
MLCRISSASSIGIGWGNSRAFYLIAVIAVKVIDGVFLFHDLATFTALGIIAQTKIGM